MQTGILDSDTDCDFPDKGNKSPINIIDHLLIRVNNSKHK